MALNVQGSSRGVLLNICHSCIYLEDLRKTTNKCQSS